MINAAAPDSRTYCSIADPVARSFRLFAESAGADCLALRGPGTAGPFHRHPAGPDHRHHDGARRGDRPAGGSRPEVLAKAIPGRDREADPRRSPRPHVADPQFAPAIVQFLAA